MKDLMIAKDFYTYSIKILRQEKILRRGACISRPDDPIGPSHRAPPARMAMQVMPGQLARLAPVLARLAACPLAASRAARWAMIT
jgi:hypothetical protein